MVPYQPVGSTSEMLLHFSEDPTLTRFVPHVAPTAHQPEPYVWAVDLAQSPAYWFPRQCPRAMAWATPSTTAADRELILGVNAERVHVIEYGWIAAMTSAELYTYHFDEADFRPFGDHAYVADHEVRPQGPPDLVRDLFELHDQAGIELRIVTDLRPWWDRVIASSVQFSGIRLRNARS
jgi:hypothetical protein